MLSFLFLIINYFTHLKTYLYSLTPSIKKNPKQGQGAGFQLGVLVYFYLYFLIVLYFKWSLLYSHGATPTTPKLSFYFYFAATGVTIAILHLLREHPGADEGLSFSYHPYLGGLVLSGLLFLSTTNDLIQFFFVLELCSYCFYLQFFQATGAMTAKQQQGPVLGGVLLYFWTNFVGSVLLLLSVVVVLHDYNMAGFDDLFYFSELTTKKQKAVLLFFIGLLLKAGAGGLHFLKVEVYKSLKIDAVLNFSFLSLVFYLFSIYALLSRTVDFFTVVAYLVVPLVVCVGLFLLVFELFRINNVVSFFGYSTVITLSLLVFLLF